MITTEVLYTISCTFKPKEDSESFHGVAICSDPDTVVTFLFEDGSAYTGKDIWTYNLHHHTPWSMLVVGRNG